MRLVIEADGDIHDLQKDEDERREKVLYAVVGRHRVELYGRIPENQKF
ncbi:MAG: DUF559 domain-containing protein [Anaerolineales bacterium]|nr:DUF559 domain-containing protein [Anaerolineales bacterium]